MAARPIRPPVAARLVAAVIASTVGLAFWWALTEPLPIPAVVLYGVAAAILFATSVIAARLGVIAAPCALLFSLFLGSLIATRLHREFTPSSAPVSRFGDALALDPSALVLPLVAAAILGGIGGLIGERILPSR